MSKKVKIILTFIFCLFISIIFNKIYAASASLSATKSNLEPGQSTTVTASISATEAWNLKITSSGGTLSGTTSDADAAGSEVSKNVMNATFTTSSEGTYTISLTGTVTGSDLKKQSVSKSVTITVKKPETKVTEPTQPTTPTETTPNFTSVNQTVYATSLVNVRSSYSTSSSLLGSLQKGASITRTGIGDNGWSKVTYNGKTAYINSGYLTTTKPAEEKPVTNETKSSNSSLKSLTVEPTGLTPEFNKDVLEYTLQIEKDVKEVKVNAVAEDSKANVKITGNTELEKEENIITIVVTAENGTTKTYNIKVLKIDKVLLGIETIYITGIDENGNLKPVTLKPVFDMATLEYECEILNNIKSLKIDAVANNEIATIEIKGNENLVEGLNVVTITLTIPDSQDLLVYTINVNKKSEELVTASKAEIQDGMFFDHNTRIILIISFTAIIGVMGIIYGIIEYRYTKNKEEVNDIKNEKLSDNDNNDKKGRHF